MCMVASGRSGTQRRNPPNCLASYDCPLYLQIFPQSRVTVSCACLTRGNSFAVEQSMMAIFISPRKTSSGSAATRTRWGKPVDDRGVSYFQYLGVITCVGNPHEAADPPPQLANFVVVRTGIASPKHNNFAITEYRIPTPNSTSRGASDARMATLKIQCGHRLAPSWERRRPLLPYTLQCFIWTLPLGMAVAIRGLFI